jgi:hypothetical protein
MNRVSVYGSLEELPTHYEDIFKDASLESGLFMSLPWFRHLAATVFAQNSRFRIYGV